MTAEPASLSDSDLVKAALTGSMAPFEELVYRYEKRIYGFVFQACGNQADACELTQDTFVRAFSALNQFNPRYPFAGWLFAIARRKCIDFHRAKRPLADHNIPNVPDFNDPSVLISEQEDRRSLWTIAHARLSPLQFDVLWLKYAEGMDVREIAHAVGKTRTHVKVLLFRARKALVKALESDDSTAGLRRTDARAATISAAVT